MANEMLNNELQALERKVTFLLQERKRAQEESAQLKAELELLRNQLKQKDQLLHDFKNQDKISKIVNTIGTGGNETSELKDKIDEYIKEIDKCILHLTQ
jgi:peptidoglycan hydrolase CwlO-like protein